MRLQQGDDVGEVVETQNIQLLSGSGTGFWWCTGEDLPGETCINPILRWQVTEEVLNELIGEKCSYSLDGVMRNLYDLHQFKKIKAELLVRELSGTGTNLTNNVVFVCSLTRSALSQYM